MQLKGPAMPVTQLPYKRPFFCITLTPNEIEVSCTWQLPVTTGCLVQASASLPSWLLAICAHDAFLSQAARQVLGPPAGGLCSHHHKHKARKAAAVPPSSSRKGQGSRPWQMNYCRGPIGTCSWAAGHPCPVETLITATDLCHSMQLDCTVWFTLQSMLRGLIGSCSWAAGRPCPLTSRHSTPNLRHFTATCWYTLQAGCAGILQLHVRSLKFYS